MRYPTWTLVAWLLGTLGAAAIIDAEPPQLWPQAGVLVLRSGRILQGEIVRVGDRYVVTLGGTDEVSVPAEAVEWHAASLDAAYRRKWEQLPQPGQASDHLALGDWCLRYELWDAAAEQLAAARQLDPGSTAADALERRLRVATRPALETSPSRPTPGPAVPFDLEQYCRNLPEGTMEQFANSVQPLLMNRCGTSGCHGPRCKSSFQLAYPSTGRALPRRFTQRNLHAAMRYVDGERPERSPLLVRATSPHGTCDRAMLSPREQAQIDQLLGWIRRATDRSTATTLSRAAGTIPQPSSGRPPGTAAQGLVAPPSAASVATRPTAAAAPAASGIDVVHAPSSATGGPEGPDPFDPEIFNQRHLRSHR